jgi:DNA-binding transcriptional LysR family regulator
MELRHLRYFVAVAEELSFTRAAVRLHMAQPALSVQIRQLEDELGVQLFDRSRRTIALTDGGNVMLTEARRLLGLLENAVELVRRTGSGAVGAIAIGFVPSASNAALPPLLRRFSATHPDVTMHLREMAPGDLVRRLHAGDLDVCFMYLPFSDPSLEQAVISREAFIVALPEDHRLAGAAVVDVGELAAEPFVIPAQHGMPGLNAQVNDICREAGFVPRAVHDDVWLVQTMIGLVAAGAGVALVPASARALRPDGVVYRPLREPVVHEVELVAVWRRDDHTPVLRAFVREITRGEASAGAEPDQAGVSP